MTPGATLFPAELYRRTARRLRCVHAKDPVRLQRSLARVARASGRLESAKAQAAQRRCSSTAQTFAGVVTERMTGPVLQYSQREKLLGTASRMGIGRFEANLIIAAVQHRVRCDETSLETPASPTTRLSARTLFLTAALVQAAIIAGVRWIVF